MATQVGEEALAGELLLRRRTVSHGRADLCRMLDHASPP
jgi:hypothetical protein